MTNRSSSSSLLEYNVVSLLLEKLVMIHHGFGCVSMRENITIAFVKIKIKDYTTLAPSSAKNFLSLKFAFIVNNSLFVIVIVKHSVC